MKTSLLLAALAALLVMGCSNKEKEDELQTALSQSQSERTSLQQNLAERDTYFDEVMKAVNEVYTDIEKARVKEKQLAQNAQKAEGPAQFTNAEVRQKLLQNIGDIGSALKENRKKINDLQAKMKSLNVKMAGLTTLIENLKMSLQEREASIAQLEARVQGLEVTIAEKTKVIADKENVIDQQQKKMNTAFYVVGTRDELKKKGIIMDEGGFLWGLLGSTTITSGSIDRSYLTPFDKTKNQKINVLGKIDEVLPRRNPSFFATAQPNENENRSELTIVSPDKFWQDNYLVIVVD